MDIFWAVWRSLVALVGRLKPGQPLEMQPGLQPEPTPRPLETTKPEAPAMPEDTQPSPPTQPQAAAEITPSTLLAPNFTWLEFTRTKQRAYLDSNFRDAQAYIEPLTEIAGLAQRVRDHYGKPLIVGSGFRSAALNAATPGSSSTSQHTKGEAVDFHVVGVDLTEVFDWIRLESGISFGQLILEGKVAGVPTWIHMSLGAPYRPAHKSQQVMRWDASNGYVRVRD